MRYLPILHSIASLDFGYIAGQIDARVICNNQDDIYLYPEQQRLNIHCIWGNSWNLDWCIVDVLKTTNFGNLYSVKMAVTGDIFYSDTEMISFWKMLLQIFVFIVEQYRLNIHVFQRIYLQHTCHDTNDSYQHH